MEICCNLVAFLRRNKKIPIFVSNQSTGNSQHIMTSLTEPLLCDKWMREMRLARAACLYLTVCRYLGMTGQFTGSTVTAAIAPWYHLRLPSCGLWFVSQTHFLQYLLLKLKL